MNNRKQQHGLITLYTRSEKSFWSWTLETCLFAALAFEGWYVVDHPFHVRGILADVHQT